MDETRPAEQSNNNWWVLGLLGLLLLYLVARQLWSRMATAFDPEDWRLVVDDQFDPNRTMNTKNPDGSVYAQWGGGGGRLPGGLIWKVRYLGPAQDVHSKVEGWVLVGERWYRFKDSLSPEDMRENFVRLDIAHPGLSELGDG